MMTLMLVAKIYLLRVPTNASMMVVMSNFPLTITLRRVIAFVTVFVKNVVTFVISRLATVAWINKDS